MKPLTPLIIFYIFSDNITIPSLQIIPAENDFNRIWMISKKLKLTACTKVHLEVC